MINGTNASGKLFDVVDEDGEVIGSFDHISEAVACGNDAPWYCGKVNIRQDMAIKKRIHSAAAAAHKAASDSWLYV